MKTILKSSGESYKNAPDTHHGHDSHGHDNNGHTSTEEDNNNSNNQ